MRLDVPRIPPVPESEQSEEVRALVAPAAEAIGEGRAPNVIATLVRHPKLYKRWNVFSTHVLFKSTLPPRDRELLILRIGWLCRAEYEWGQHVRIGKAAGLTDEEIVRIPKGADASGWSELDRALIRATDELHADAFVSDPTWAALAEHYGTEQLMDVVFAVGQYNLVCMALNSFGVQLDDDIEGFPNEAR